MQTQRHHWLKIIITGGIVVRVIYLFAQPAENSSGDKIDASAAIQTTASAIGGDSGEPNNQAIAKTLSSASSTSNQTDSRELKERLQFSASEVAAAVDRTTSWTPAEEIPHELPLQPEEFTDADNYRTGWSKD